MGAETLFLNHGANGRTWLGTRKLSRDQDIRVALRDRRGFLWVGRSTFGLLRKGGEATQSETELGNDFVECLFEDPGTNNRLSAFRFGKMSRMTARDGLSRDTVSAVEVTGVTVWVGTQTGLNRIHNMRVETQLRGLNVSVVKRAARSSLDGDTWRRVHHRRSTHRGGAEAHHR